MIEGLISEPKRSHPCNPPSFSRVVVTSQTAFLSKRGNSEKSGCSWLTPCSCGDSKTSPATAQSFADEYTKDSLSGMSRLLRQSFERGRRCISLNRQSVRHSQDSQTRYRAIPRPVKSLGNGSDSRSLHRQQSSVHNCINSLEIHVQFADRSSIYVFFARQDVETSHVPCWEIRLS